MKLSELLSGIATASPYSDVTVSDVTNDSRKAGNGVVYAAIRGTNLDGHRFAQSALEQGAAAVLVDHDMGLDGQIIVENTREAYALACANLFGNPSKKLKLVGVTGTNGKTSVTTMVRHILEASGLKTGLIGTIQIEYGDVVKENKNTTPDAYVFHQTLAEMLKAGCQYAVTEVSSHALAQDRLFGCHFEVCVFTNLTQDHLDYHKDMEDYFQAKRRLFSMGNRNIVNIHDPYGKRLAEELGEDTVTFCLKNPEADFSASDIVCTPGAVDFRVLHDGVASKVHFAIPGLYSVENAMAAISICSVLGIPLDSIIKALGQIKGIKGRSEIVYRDETMTVICDYAHTPDGIENILKSMKECTHGRLVALFGCGGDRDTKKRPLMAKACEKFADFIIVTSDNPRSEDPEAIIREILPGLSEQASYITIPDRREAIAYAMHHAQTGDTIVLLGKGHEDYQILKDRTIHFDEREVVAQIAAELKK